MLVTLARQRLVDLDVRVEACTDPAVELEDRLLAVRDRGVGLLGRHHQAGCLDRGDLGTLDHVERRGTLLAVALAQTRMERRKQHLGAVLQVDGVVGDDGRGVARGVSDMTDQGVVVVGLEVVEIGHRELVGVAGAVLVLHGDDLDAQPRSLGEPGERVDLRDRELAPLAGEPPPTDHVRRQSSGVRGGRFDLGRCHEPGASSEREIKNQ